MDSMAFVGYDLDPGPVITARIGVHEGADQHAAPAASALVGMGE